jgi:hypothetical protein
MTNNSRYSRRGTPVEELLAGPLLAVAYANSTMAYEQVRFLLNYCFIKTNDTYRPVTISMKLTRSVMPPDNKDDTAEFTQVSLIFELPLITLIPLNSLVLEKVTISFEMEVTSQFNPDRKQNKDLQSTGKSGQVQLAGNISYDSRETLTGNEKSHYAKKNNSKIMFNAKVGPLPLPLGLTTILEAYTKNIPQNSTSK